MAERGLWCLWCGAMLKAEQAGFHIWQHGAVASIGRCDVSAPSPWSKRQGYWHMNPNPPERLSKRPPAEPLPAPASAIIESAAAPPARQPGLFGDGE